MPLPTTLPTNWRAFRATLRAKEDDLRRNIESRKRLLPKLVAAKRSHGLARSMVLAPIDLLHLWIACGDAMAREYTVYAGAPMKCFVSELEGDTWRFAPQSWMSALSSKTPAKRHQPFFRTHIYGPKTISCSCSHPKLIGEKTRYAPSFKLDLSYPIWPRLFAPCLTLPLILCGHAEHPTELREPCLPHPRAYAA